MHLVKSINEAYSANEWHETNSYNHQYIRKSKRKKLPQSLPRWLLLLMSKLTGVKTSETDKPIIGLLVYIWLLTGSLGFLIGRFWYMFVDIQNVKTSSTFFNESFTVILMLIWCSIGIYAFRVAGYVFSSPSLLNHIRMHTRTFLKINSSVILIIMVAFYAGCNLRRYIVLNVAKDLKNCSINELPLWFCDFWFGFGVIYSIPAIFFNIVVSMVILSIMRTHTIVLRRQISDMERDEKVMFRITQLKKKHNEKVFFLPQIEISTTEEEYEYEWVNEANEHDHDSVELQSHQEVIQEQQQQLQQQQQQQLADGNITSYSISTALRDLDIHKAAVKEYENLLLSPDEILYRYRTLFNRAFVISLFFQRWMLCWLLFVVIWTISYVIEWLEKEPNDWQIILLILPIMIFWIVCSAYAEVNNESQRFVKSIYPTPERFMVLRYMTQSPVQMGVFQVPLSYTTMMSIFVAMGVALISKIILDEVHTKT